MSKTVKDLSFICAFVLTSTLLIWLPYLLKIPNFWGLNFSHGFETIYRNFDGLEYIIIAKTGYSPEILKTIPQFLPEKYYASHFPGFSIIIYLFSFVFGYLKSMLLVSLIFTITSAAAFYFLVKDFKLTTQPLFLTLVFLILPARWIVVRSVGSAEPMFIFFTLLTFYFLLKALQNGLRPGLIFLSAITAVFATLTRPPGVLIALSILIFLIWQTTIVKEKTFLKIKYLLSFYPFLLVPLTLLGIFYWFGASLGDFWAYFHSGDNIHLVFPPFQVFNINQYWVGTAWLEDVVYIFILELFGGLLLLKQKMYPIAFFVLTYLLASFFVAHRDISRYTLPITPFVIIAFEKVLVSREFKIVLVILSLAIYLYTQNFILTNTAPVPNLSAFN